MIITRRIPSRKLWQFHEIMCATGGRYNRNPLWISDDTVEVCFQPGDYMKMQQALDRVMVDITEIRKDQWWRKILRRVGISV